MYQLEQNLWYARERYQQMQREVSEHRLISRAQPVLPQRHHIARATSWGSRLVTLFSLHRARRAP